MIVIYYIIFALLPLGLFYALKYIKYELPKPLIRVLKISFYVVFTLLLILTLLSYLEGLTLQNENIKWYLWLYFLIPPILLITMGLSNLKKIEQIFFKAIFVIQTLFLFFLFIPFSKPTEPDVFYEDNLILVRDYSPESFISSYRFRYPIIYNKKWIFKQKNKSQIDFNHGFEKIEVSKEKSNYTLTLIPKEKGEEPYTLNFKTPS